MTSFGARAAQIGIEFVDVRSEAPADSIVQMVLVGTQPSVRLLLPMPDRGRCPRRGHGRTDESPRDPGGRRRGREAGHRRGRVPTGPRSSDPQAYAAARPLRAPTPAEAQPNASDPSSNVALVRARRPADGRGGSRTESQTWRSSTRRRKEPNLADFLVAVIDGKVRTCTSPPGSLR